MREAELAFPPELSAAERKVVHDICYELDLTCKSRGPKKAGGRFITVYKPDAAQSAKLKAQRDAHTLGRSPHAQLPRSSTPGPMLFCWSIAAPDQRVDHFVVAMSTINVGTMAKAQL